MNVALDIPHFAGRMGEGLPLNPRRFDKLKEHIDNFIKKTSLKYYKNVSVISVIGVA